MPPGPLAKLSATGKPRPRPLAIPLVEKNGSKAQEGASGVMPMPSFFSAWPSRAGRTEASAPTRAMGYCATSASMRADATFCCLPAPRDMEQGAKQTTADKGTGRTDAARQRQAAGIDNHQPRTLEISAIEGGRRLATCSSPETAGKRILEMDRPGLVSPDGRGWKHSSRVCKTGAWCLNLSVCTPGLVRLP